MRSVSECADEPSATEDERWPADGPEIDIFAARPDRVRAGQVAILSWQTINSEEVTLSEAAARGADRDAGAVRRVAGSGEIRVRPSRTTTYRLQAKSGPSSTERAVTIHVVASAGPTAPPPPPRDEQVTSRPGYVWMPGRWDWRDGEWTWMRGRWERAKSDHRWVPCYWRPEGDAYVWVPGRWERNRVRDHRNRTAPDSGN